MLIDLERGLSDSDFQEVLLDKLRDSVFTGQAERHNTTETVQLTRPFETSN